MNRNEQEQWMKESLGNQEFTPNAQGWNKLQDALSPAPATRPERKVLPMVFWRRIAASVALLTAAGGGYYFLQHKSNSINTTITSVTSGNLQQQSSPAILPSLNDASSTSVAQKSYNPSLQSAATPMLHQQKRPITDNEPTGLKDTITSENLASNIPAPVDPVNNQQPHAPGSRVPDIGFDEPLMATPQAINLGVAAQVGRVSVGKMQYQLGILAHKKISEKLFAEATLSLASTEVSYTQQSNFKSVAVSIDGIATTSEQSVEAKYGKNIVSLGISPNIGYKVTSGLSVSLGGALARNLNQSLALKNEGNIDAAAFKSEVIVTSQNINKWDAGITGSAAYQIDRRLKVQVQYRYGLTNYIYSNNQAIRNSGMNIGVNYLFGQ